MPSFPPERAETVARIYAHHVRSARSGRREHLGASEIGEECSRRLWYSFRWCVGSTPTVKPDDHVGRLLRLFRRGDMEEPRLIEELRAIGCEVHDRNPETDAQFRFDQHGGHYGGSMDGVVLGLPEAPKTWHVLEVKTASRASWTKLAQDGVEVAQPKHFGQMQAYMHELGIDRAAYFATNKDTEELYYERVERDAAKGEALRRKALRVIQADEPLERISEKADKPPCAWCDAKPVCHERKLPEAHCRTCIHARPMLDGQSRWHCALRKVDLTAPAQEVGCREHLYVPALLEGYGRPVDATENAIIYESPDGTRWANAGESDFPPAPSFGSAELQRMINARGKVEVEAA